MNKFKLGLIFVALFIFASSAAQSVEWLPMEKAQKMALENDKKVMVYAMATWCGYCQKMKDEVFPQESVSDSLHKYFYPVKLNIESGEELTFNGKKYTERMLTRKFRVYSTPTFIFLTPEGEVIGVQPRFIPADVFDKLLAYVGAGLYQKMPFRKYLNENELKTKAK